MLRKERPLSAIFGKPLRFLLRVPGVYPFLAFLLGRRAVVSGWSMSPTLSPGEYVLYDRLAYRLAPPRPGDVVLASHPARPRMRIVKRVVAQPGDSVTIDGDRCWVNGTLWGATGDAGRAGPAVPAGARTLGEDEWLLLGDAPYASTDGRDFGPAGRGLIHARAWLVYWPPSRMRVVRGDPHTEGQA